MDEVRCLVLERRTGRAASLWCHLLHILIERSVLLYCSCLYGSNRVGVHYGYP
jgi:hypothetical protein